MNADLSNSGSHRRRRILGVDPGSQTTGFGIIDDCGNELQSITSGTIRTLRQNADPTTGKPNFGKRLRILYENLTRLIEKYKPEVVAVESVFHSVNAQSALKLGHARGVVLLAAAQYDLDLFEYTPRAIKKGLTGFGAAEKSQVRKMVQMILHGSHPTSLDAADALAVAIYHCHHNPWYQTAAERVGLQATSAKSRQRQKTVRGRRPRSRGMHL